MCFFCFGVLRMIHPPLLATLGPVIRLGNQAMNSVETARAFSSSRTAADPVCYSVVQIPKCFQVISTSIYIPLLFAREVGTPVCQMNEIRAELLFLLCYRYLAGAQIQAEAFSMNRRAKAEEF